MPVERIWDVWNEYEQWLYKIIYASVRNHTDTEDILHDTLIKAVMGYDRLRDSSKARSWFASIASNTIADHFRRKAREQLWETDHFDRIISRYEAVDVDKIVIESFLGDLPPDWRSVVVMNLYLGLSSRCIAEITGGSFHAIHKRLTRTYKLLAKSLSE